MGGTSLLLTQTNKNKIPKRNKSALLKELLHSLNKNRDHDQASGVGHPRRERGTFSNGEKLGARVAKDRLGGWFFGGPSTGEKGVRQQQDGFWEGTARATGEAPGPEHSAGGSSRCLTSAQGRSHSKELLPPHRGAESSAGIPVAVSLRVAPLL